MKNSSWSPVLNLTHTSFAMQLLPQSLGILKEFAVHLLELHVPTTEPSFRLSSAPRVPNTCID